LLLPRITSFTPTGGAPGAVVTLNGDGLAGATGVWFGGVEAVRATNVSAARVDAVVPTGALAGPITLTTVNGTNVTSAPFIVAPTISTADAIEKFGPVEELKPYLRYIPASAVK
jgi:hypothetical protein